MKKLLSVALVFLAMGFTQVSASVVVQWNFDDDAITPSTGTGTAANVGETSSAFATGNGGGRGWNTSAYRAQSTASGTAGVQFLADMAGFQGIQFSFDHRSSGTGSRWAQIDYTLDGGTNWTTGFWNNSGGLSPHDTFYSFNVDFSSVVGANNNANFGVRIVSIFSPLAFSENTSNNFGANSAYMRANAQAVYGSGPGSGTGTYGVAGTWRFDNVTFAATAIPEPSSMLALGSMAVLGLLRNRFKKQPV